MQNALNDSRAAITVCTATGIRADVHRPAGRRTKGLHIPILAFDIIYGQSYCQRPLASPPPGCFLAEDLKLALSVHCISFPFLLGYTPLSGIKHCAKSQTS